MKDPSIQHPGPNATMDELRAYFQNIEWVPIGDAPPVCDLIGVPCYCDGSAMRAEEWFNILVSQGSDKIWEMMEAEYHDLFDEKDAPEPVAKDWELSVQGDRDMHRGSFAEAICPHGVGHHKGIHGCDGCCANPSGIS
jgi:hypothetical protein